jgi:hypothetical protein
MKGRKQELLREEVHAVLKSHFQCRRSIPNTGMSELLIAGICKTRRPLLCASLDAGTDSRRRRSLSAGNNPGSGGISVLTCKHLVHALLLLQKTLEKKHGDGSLKY